MYLKLQSREESSFLTLYGRIGKCFWPFVIMGGVWRTLCGLEFGLRFLYLF